MITASFGGAAAGWLWSVRKRPSRRTRTSARRDRIGAILHEQQRVEIVVLRVERRDDRGRPVGVGGFHGGFPQRHLVRDLEALAVAFHKDTYVRPVRIRRVDPDPDRDFS